MTIEQRLDQQLKDAMRAKDKDTIACVRQVRSKAQEAVNAPEFAGETDDAFFQKIIGSYVKSLQKGIGELEAAGERGKPLRDKYAAEITLLENYLPKRLDEAATRKLVEQIVADQGITDAKRAGQVMGMVMKNHRDEVDAALLKRVVDSVLGG